MTRIFGGLGCGQLNGLVGLCSSASRLFPVLLYFYPWPMVLGAVVVIAFLWRALLVPFWVSPTLAFLGPLFVKLKFVAAPVMAYLLWRRGDAIPAAAALLWPVLGPIVTGLIMALPQALLLLTPLGKASQIGPVQIRFLRRLDFSRRTPCHPKVARDDQ
jgi:hypothetical protein